MKVITVVVAARGRTRRVACRRLLRPSKLVRVVGEARSVRQATAAVRRKPNVLLLDFNLAREDGFSLLRVFRVDSPATRVILLVDRASEARILDALSRGARGYLHGRALPAFLVKAVSLVNRGEAWVPRTMVAKLIERLVRVATHADTGD